MSSGFIAAIALVLAVFLGDVPGGCGNSGGGGAPVEEPGSGSSTTAEGSGEAP